MYKVLLVLKSIKLYVLNPHFVICFGISWLITNGWAYLGAAAGSFFESEWLMGISSAYLALLWLPFTPEKLVTLMLSVLLLKFLFPRDKKTLRLITALRNSLKNRRSAVRTVSPEGE